MIDRILKAGRDEDWILATKLLYEHWTENCPKVFVEKTENPWLSNINEARVYDELIRPIASLYIGEEIKPADFEDDEDRGCSLQRLANEYGCSVENDGKGQICGKRFENGELTYHCKDCEADGTCVLCKECFERSEHRNHNHKVTVSIGGGYCDCGDPEAWKNDFACDDHKPIETEDGMETQSLIIQIPPQIESRLKQLTLSVILYSISVLVSDGDEKLSNLLNLSSKSKVQNNFQAILYNDETHTYDAVIKALVNAINVSDETACKIATIIDKEGRAAVKIGAKSDCEKVRQIITKKTSRENPTNKSKKEGPLEVKVLSSVTVAVQDFAFFLLKWLNKQMTIFTPLQSIVADICLNRYCNPDSTIDNLCSAPTITKEINDKSDDDDDVQAMDVGTEKVESLRIIDSITDDVQTFFDTLTKPREQIPKSDAELARERCSGRKKDNGDIIIALMIKANIKWWKSVRLTTQSFIMTALVRRLDYKIQFSRLFIAHYKKLLKDYCLDDHHQSASVLSLTVQYFTVPTVAKAIIAGDNAFGVCMQTIIKLMNSYLKKAKYNQALDVYDFQDGAYGKHPFYVKRLSTILVDVQYLLQSVPSQDEWTSELRAGFLHGVDDLLRFLGYIQDMNQTVKHYGEHQVWEMEWETAFYLQLFLQNVIPLVVDWAISDFEVYKEVFKRVYDKIKDLISKHPEMSASKKEITINGITASCIDFNINWRPISIHQPIWRIFAALFTANNKTFLKDITTNASGIRLEWEPTPYRMHLDLAIMSEPALRCIVFYNQVTLGMWRKNGFGVVNQCHNYNSANCRGEMFDRDIILLQATAALTDSDQFLIRIIHRYGLNNWANLDFDYDLLKANHEASLANDAATNNSNNEDAITRIPNNRTRFLRTTIVGTDFRMDTVFGHNNQTPPNQSPLLEDSSKHLTGLAEEMLNLVIYLVCERYVKGVGKVTLQDILEREIIHMLSITSLPYSRIEKITNWGDFTEELLQSCLQNVATYSHPEKSVPGIFTLKEEIKPYFSQYFYHYNKTESSRAEQTQKESRRNLDLELRCCPPHELPEFDDFYKNVPNILKCTIFVCLQKAILERFIRKSRFSSEGLVNRVCYTICLALNEQRRHNKPDTYDYISIGENYGILKLLEGTLTASPSSNCCDMITYTIQKYEEVLAWCSGKEIVKEKISETKDLQDEIDKANKRAEKAKRLREQAMKKMMNKASNFMKNSTMNESPKEGITATTSQSPRLLSVMDDDEETGEIVNDKGFPVCLGAHKSEILPIEKKQSLCILCQDTGDLKFGKTGFVCCAFAYKSYLFTQKDYINSKSNNNLDVFVDAYVPESLAIMTCGHTIHYQCFKNFQEAYKSRNNSRTTNTHNTRIIDIDGGEYLCPLCKRISNCAIPYIPHQDFSGITKLSLHTLSTKDEDFSTWLLKYRTAVKGPSKKIRPTDDKQPYKGHSRKRSHSERSLLDLAKQGDKPFIDNNLSSTPAPKFVSEASLSINADVGDSATNTPNSEAFRSSTNIGSIDSSFFDTVSPKNLLSNFKHMKKKAYLYKSRKDSIPRIMRDTDMIYNFINEMAEFRKESFTSKDQNQKYLKVCNIWHTCVFILRQVAGILEEENKPLFGALNFRQRESLKCLTRMATASSNFISSINSRSLTTILLQPLLYPLNANDGGKSSKEDKTTSPFPVLSKFHVSLMQRANSISSEDSNNQRNREVKSPEHDMGQETLSTKVANRIKKQDSILNIDCLTLAFDLIMVIGHTSINGEVYLHDRYNEASFNLVVDGSQDELNVIQLVLYAHIFQILATFENNESDDIDMPIQDETYFKIMDIVNAIGKDDKQFVKNIERNFSKVKENIIKGILGYLRPLAIFYRTLTLIPPPEVLKDPGFDQLSPLLRYMGLPSSLEELFSVEDILPLYEMWGKQLPNKTNGLNNQIYVKQPITINKLIDLPKNFIEIIVEASKFRCPSSLRIDNVSSNPSLCLVCGKILCTQSICCQTKINKNEEIGAGNLHMQTCTGQNGLFLRMRECIIEAVTTKNRGAHYSGPYVDKYGEQDGGNKRGNMLFFSEHLYSKFKKAWLHQDVVEMIINENEVNHRLSIYEWRQF
ncbi:E3 ubiquitin-protein ligase UBR2 [Strongyloides ratti]|uniref:E3 ubiquitin-protein ligase n=1 Tax=Strongyloides ratti TaxID=34506 RepID=A0A090LAD7_STRRB|nr:E3 ubiquitin-protein ligase UBR2 [Strongyloides ratti]CEF64505.1 E3 ubiquitin-protein ligase UBR2 [Strongyloides ratti]